MIPGKLDEFGRLRIPIKDEGEERVNLLIYDPLAKSRPKTQEEPNPEPSLDEEEKRAKRAKQQTKQQELIQKCQDFLESEGTGLKEWCDENFGEEHSQEALDCVHLCLLGVMTQDADTCARVLNKSREWTRPKTKILRKMGLWVGNKELGARFSAWMGEGDYSGLRNLFDVMEIQGLVESRPVDGDYEYKLTERGDNLRNKE